MRLLRANRCGPRVGYRVAFLEDGPMVCEVEQLGYETRVFEAGRLRNGVQFLGTVRALSDWLRATSASVVLSWMPKAHLYAGLAARARRLPAIWFQHTIPTNRLRDHVTAQVPAVGVLCCSAAAARAQARQWPSRRTSVVYPCIDPAAFALDREQVEALKRAWGLPAHRRIVGMVARLQRWKGVHVFVDAAARISNVRTDVAFVVVGGAHASEQEYPDELRRQAVEAGLHDRLFFVGHQVNMPAWYGAMDVVVHASTEPEPFGMVLIEAMAQAKPVVATRAGGPMEIIADEEQGRLIAPGDAEALAEALLELLDAPDRRIAIGQAARARARWFSQERLAAELALRVDELTRYGR